MPHVLIGILFVKQNILFKINPLLDKNKPYVKKSFDLLLLYLYDRLALVLEVLYERNCSTKGAAQLILNRVGLNLWHIRKCLLIFSFLRIKLNTQKLFSSEAKKIFCKNMSTVVVFWYQCQHMGEQMLSQHFVSWHGYPKRPTTNWRI